MSADNPSNTDSNESMEGVFSASLREVEEGELLSGHVVSINANDVVVDVGYKSEGIIKKAEFVGPTGEFNLKVGDEVFVFLERKEGDDGELILSHAKAERMRTWDKVSNSHEKSESIDATVLRRVKGGLTVDLGGVEAFLPGSQVALKTLSNLDQFVGQTFPVRVLKVNKRRANVVVSRRVLLEEVATVKKDELLKNIQPGQVVKGTIKTLTTYGAFVDLGGMDGLLHITDMSWGRISHPSQILKVEQEIEVVVLSVDATKGKVSLGLKQRTSDPWLDVETRYQPGQIMDGTVSSLAEYGAFIRLEDGVEGLVHVSEVTWGRKIKHPNEILKMGQALKVKILGVDSKAKRISLSIRQAEADPWSTVSERYSVGKKLSGIVRGVADFGVFVEVEEGIEGLVHISDLTWSRKVKHPSELVKKGDSVEVVVISADPVAKRLSLGIKQLQDDPWTNIHEKYRVGMEVKAVITNTASFGAFAALDDEIEGLIPITHLSNKAIKKAEDVVQIGQEVLVKITKIQPHAHKIALSLRTSSGQERPGTVQ